MKKKLILLCGALVVAAAVVSITVASRSTSSFSDITMSSVESLSQGELTGLPREGVTCIIDIICYYYLPDGEVVKTLAQAQTCAPITDEYCSWKSPC